MSQPELWIHGHDHGSHDYRVGRTRIFANQAGYPDLLGRENRGFDPRCVINCTPCRTLRPLQIYERRVGRKRCSQATALSGCDA